MIRDLQEKDQNKIIEIYAQGLATRNATFETEVPDWQTWNSKYHPFCRFVYCLRNGVVGWAALTPVSSRHCYRGVAEVSIYVEEIMHGQGIGSKLLEKLITESEKQNIWTLQSSVFPENKATVGLHLKHGFRELGIRNRVAQLENQWRDTLIMERRSQICGV